MIRDVHEAWVASKKQSLVQKPPRKKREEEHRKKFMSAIRRVIPSAVPLRHEDTRTAGIPDISVTLENSYSYASRVVWLECKAKTLDGFKTEVQGPKTGKKRGLQRETLRRLGGHYIVFDRGIMYIVDPTDLSVVSSICHDPKRPSREPYDALALFIKGMFI